MNNLSGKTLSGLKNMSISSIIIFILQFLTTIFLARIFSPSEFGIITAITIVTSYTDILWEIGIGPALIQKKVINQNDINTAFTTSLVLGFITTIIIVLSSPILANMINIGNHIILQVISISFVINSLGVVPLSLLQRDMQFGVIIKKDIISNLVYTLCAMILGVIGLKVWALVIALLLRNIVGTTISWFFCNKRKIQFDFNKKSFKNMMHFGIGYSLSRVINVTTNQSDYFVISRILGTHALGIYNRAFQLMTIPATLIGQVIDQVFFPAMSKIQDNNRKLGNIFIFSTAFLSIIYFPLSIAIYLFSNEIVLLLLGPNWVEAADPLGILALTLFFRVGYKISDPLFRAKGAVYNRALIHFIQAIMTVVASLIGVRWGLLGVSIGVGISLILNYIIITIKTYNLVEFDVISYFKCLLPPMFYFGFTLGVLRYIEEKLNFITNNNIFTLGIIILVFCILVSLVIFLIFLFWPKEIRHKISSVIKQYFNYRQINRHNAEGM